MKKPFLSKGLWAITDVETTGLDERKHEIIEIGLALVDPRTLEIQPTWGDRVKPRHPERASPEALKVNGYNPDEWQDAISLRDAIKRYRDVTVDAEFVAWNVTFDWRFMNKAFVSTRLQSKLHYHRVCLYSIARERFREANLPSYSLDGVAKYLGLEPEVKPHRAINGALKELEVLRKIRFGQAFPSMRAGL